MLSNLEHPENRSASSPANDAPLVDVTLITYNHERFVARAIEGVLSQQTRFSVHLIIGDDCSSDNTQDIIKKYAADCDQPVTLLLDQEHRGLMDPGRVGIRALTLGQAKYIALLDGDDYWTSQRKLQKQVEFLESHPDFAICFHNALMFFEDGSQPSRNLLATEQKAVSTFEDLLETNFIPTSTTLIRRSALPTLPSWLFELSVADWPLYVLIAEQGKIGYLDEVMANYRVHQKGAWSSGTELNRATEVITMFEHLDRHFDYKYQRKIRLTKAEWYYLLSETACSSGDLLSSQRYFRNYVDCEGSVLQRRIGSLVLRAYLPRLYRLLKAVRDRLRPASRGPVVTKRLGERLS
ncbi:MAG TPA: glycosyltransferase [Pyrinomonadaceae bacterium]|nr:glycosyltransferase [Pyrinomonadaceae bacterium]